jgi:hypothetical protein
MQLVFLALFLLVVIFFLRPRSCASKKETFVEQFAKAGYEAPKDNIQIDVDLKFDDSDYNLVEDVTISPDEMRSCIVPTIELIKKETGLCVAPVETTKIKLYTNTDNRKLFVCNFMFMVTSTGFPFGFGIDVTVLEGKIVKANTQKIHKGILKPYSPDPVDNFLPASELFVKPNLSY